jgi:hypothetical protein
MVLAVCGKRSFSPHGGKNAEREGWMREAGRGRRERLREREREREVSRDKMPSKACAYPLILHVAKNSPMD